MHTCWLGLCSLVLMLSFLCLLEKCDVLLACSSSSGSTPACPAPPGKLLMPAPPGTAVVYWTFSSWDGLELQYSMVLLGVVLMELWCCGRTCEFLCCSNAGLVLLGCEHLALAEPIFTSCWLSWVAVVLPAAASQLSDWAACELCVSLHHSAWSDPPLAVLLICYEHIALVPQCFLLRTVTILDQIHSMMQLVI
jgi:hypothetical protein